MGLPKPLGKKEFDSALEFIAGRMSERLNASVTAAPDFAAEFRSLSDTKQDTVLTRMRERNLTLEQVMAEPPRRSNFGLPRITDAPAPAFTTEESSDLIEDIVTDIYNSLALTSVPDIGTENQIKTYIVQNLLSPGREKLLGDTRLLDAANADNDIFVRAANNAIATGETFILNDATSPTRDLRFADSLDALVEKKILTPSQRRLFINPTGDDDRPFDIQNARTSDDAADVVAAARIGQGVLDIFNDPESVAEIQNIGGDFGEAFGSFAESPKGQEFLPPVTGRQEVTKDEIDKFLKNQDAFVSDAINRLDPNFNPKTNVDKEETDILSQAHVREKDRFKQKFDALVADRVDPNDAAAAIIQELQGRTQEDFQEVIQGVRGERQEIEARDRAGDPGIRKGEFNDFLINSGIDPKSITDQARAAFELRVPPGGIDQQFVHCRRF